MSTEEEIEAIKNKFRQAMPHFRLALEIAKRGAGEGGKVGLGVIAVPKEGDGRITAQFHGEEFFEDIATLCGVGPDTEEDELEAKAQQIVDQFPGITSTELG